MTSKISCFDRAVFRRALKKTAPVWILYTLYELLLPLRLFSFCRGVSSCTDDFLVQIEKTILGYARINASLLPFLLGGLLAWVLFFWLFRAGTAYFYAALPVRRETLFLTNYLTGLLLCAAPALLSSLLLWAVGAGFGAAVFVPAMQVFTATMLGFLLFFSFAVLVCCVVGQMAAMPIVYVILNFTFFVLEAIVRHLLFTFVYGMPYKPEQHHAVVCAARHAGAGAAAGRLPRCDGLGRARRYVLHGIRPTARGLGLSRRAGRAGAGVRAVRVPAFKAP